MDAQCQGAKFWRAQCQGASFYHAHCQGARFWKAQCQGASFYHAHCQGANFWGAQCQGAIFYHVHCQGAYSIGEDLILEKRIGKNTELGNMIFAGALDKLSIQNIESAKAYLDDEWYQEMQKIIKENQNKDISHKLPKGIIIGVLDDSEEIQAIIAGDWEKFERIQAEKRNNRALFALNLIMQMQYTQLLITNI